MTLCRKYFVILSAYDKDIHVFLWFQKLFLKFDVTLRESNMSYEPGGLQLSSCHWQYYLNLFVYYLVQSIQKWTK